MVEKEPEEKDVVDTHDSRVACLVHSSDLKYIVLLVKFSQ